MTPWNLSCTDWKDKLKQGKPLVPSLPLFPSGDRAVKIFDRLRLYDVVGTPTMEEAGGAWFRDIIRVLFGSYDAATKQRYINELFLLVCKKNNKTTGGALLMLTALLLNERPHAPFLMTAPVHKTAEDAFNAAAGAIALDPVLEKKFHVKDHVKQIIHRETKAVLQILTFDPEVVTGKKVCGALIDEYHILGKMNRASRSMVQLRGGMQPFPESFLVIITTQSDEMPAGVFKSDLEKARDIRDGRKTGRVLPVLYEFPKEVQTGDGREWENPDLWSQVNPNMGKSVQLPALVEAYENVKEKDEAEVRIWASQHLNVEIGLALHANRWSGADYWEGCGDESLSLDSLIARSDAIDIGIDGGGLDDLLALAVIGRDTVTGEKLHWAKAWGHPSVIERRKGEAERLQGFEKDGDLVLVKEIGEDVLELADICSRIFETGLLDKIGCDPLGLGTVLDELDNVGIPSDMIVGISQGYKLTGAIKTLGRWLAEGVITHCASELMAWSVGNAKVELRGNAETITKQNAGSAKIDPLCATLNAASLMQLNPESKTIDDFIDDPLVA